ncbi:hypothetical protein [Duganella sp. P38]|uniref:hypothetical protein n=1 Tax=Duganella sp. P38 TaxID=3423949 RepID=UPI003D7BB07A
MKIKTVGFNRICVIGKSQASESGRINSSKVLVVEVPLDIEEYNKLSRDDVPEYFIGLLKVGFEKAIRNQSLPIHFFGDVFEIFRAEGYMNRWTHATKKFPSIGGKCNLNCELDLSWFRLTLVIERDGEGIFSEEILRTLPDEIVYAHRFKNLQVNGRTLTVYDKFGIPLWEMSVI